MAHLVQGRLLRATTRNARGMPGHRDPQRWGTLRDVGELILYFTQPYSHLVYIPCGSGRLLLRLKGAACSETYVRFAATSAQSKQLPVSIQVTDLSW